MELEVETINKETIKPSSPTVVGLRIFKLSLLDQIASTVYISLIFWYPNDTDAVDYHFAKVKERSQKLKKSLSEILARFYHFAGRKRSNSFIECNDEGVDYIEARVQCLLQDILKKPNGDVLRKLLPIQRESIEGSELLLLVKVNFFECGGMAIGVSISHKIADLSTLSIFIKSWAALAKGSIEEVPEFQTLSSLLPPIDLPIAAPQIEFKQEKCVTRRLVFDAFKISLLRAQAASTDVPQPTRVEAVTALIWKCAMAATKSNRCGFTKSSVMLLPVNFRKRVKPPLPENFIGNLAFGFCAQTTQDCETELEGLVQKLRNGIKEFSGKFSFSTILEDAKKLTSMSGRDDVDFYCCSSWCRFELYGADFGWGKPRWVSSSGVAPQNICTLMDSRDGEGVEAWLTLSEAEMAFFERNEELLAFASVGPSVTLITTFLAPFQRHFI